MEDALDDIIDEENNKKKDKNSNISKNNINSKYLL